MTEKPTTADWKRRALRAEARYQQLHDDVRAARAQDMGMIIELADSRHFKTQARALLVEAIALLDSIADADTEAQLRQPQRDQP